MRATISLCSLLLFLGPVWGAAETPERAPEVLRAHETQPWPVDESLRREAMAALDRGYQWLLAHQREDGSWSNRRFPALTAFPVWALAQSRHGFEKPVRRGVQFVLNHAQVDGGIYDPAAGLGVYNTAISMTALYQTGQPDLIPVIQNARKFMADAQHLVDDLYYGGMGYDRAAGREYADLSNSAWAFTAMRMTEGVEDFREGERVDLDWEAALQFVQRTQNLPDYNELPWATDIPSERGGFVYRPDQTRAGTFVDDDGVVRLRSMPGMTYAGLLSYIYAEVDRDDPRVQATVDWVIRHWQLDRNNPISGGDERHDTEDEREGLFYLYNVMSKGLSAYGQDQLIREDGPPINWRAELIETLLAHQRIDPKTGYGYWMNEVSRYWEGDAVLVTSYALLVIQMALGM